MKIDFDYELHLLLIFHFLHLLLLRSSLTGVSGHDAAAVDSNLYAIEAAALD